MSTCDQFPMVLRWRDAGQTAQVKAHLESCEACAAAWSDLEALTALGRALPDPQPTTERRESVRTRLLAQASAPPVSRGRRSFVAAAAVLLIGLGTWRFWPVPVQSPTPWAQITPSPGAQFERQRTQTEETVLLRDGMIAVYVSHLDNEQRVRVLTVDAEVEVRGTRFSVSAVDGRLQTVEVISGRVEVRPQAGPSVELLDGQRWRAPVEAISHAKPSGRATPVETPVRSTPPNPPVVSNPKVTGPRPTVPKAVPKEPASPTAGAPSVEQPVAPASPQTIQFEAGWVALRGGKSDAAVTAFTAAAEMAGPLVADAHWWRAVALGRAGRDGETLVALNRYLARYPTSVRRAEASVMLGWLHFAAGRMDAAEKAFRGGSGAQRPAVKRRAEEGLEAVVEWRNEGR